MKVPGRDILVCDEAKMIFLSFGCGLGPEQCPFERLSQQRFKSLPDTPTLCLQFESLHGMG